MANSTLNSEIRSKIDAFVEQLTAHVKKAALDSVREALGNGVAPARRGPGRPRMNVKVGRPAKSAMTGKRSAEDVAAMAEKVAAYVKANEGQRLDQIAVGMNLTTKELTLPVAKLLASKQLRKAGIQRGTKYFVGGSSGNATAAAPKTKAKRGKKK